MFRGQRKSRAKVYWRRRTRNVDACFCDQLFIGLKLVEPSDMYKGLDKSSEYKLRQCLRAAL